MLAEFFCKAIAENLKSIIFWLLTVSVIKFISSFLHVICIHISKYFLLCELIFLKQIDNFKTTFLDFLFPRITDAMNDTKDKVKYLESLRRHFDQLYQDATPASIINNAIPGIVNSVRQMDSISRYYARTGFLGIVFTKITNQLVLACKEYIKNCTITAYDGDELWVRIKEEIRNRDSLPVVDPQQRMLRNQVEAKIKVRDFRSPIF